MASLHNNEVFYVAGIGLLLNIILFATTLLIYLCKPRTENTDIEALDHHLRYQFEDDDHFEDDDRLNVALLQETKGLRLINLIPAMKYIQVPKDDGESNRGIGCSICLKEGYEDDEMCRILPGCCHVFHSHCIDEWLKKKQSCPVCRKSFQVVLSNIIEA